MESGQNGGDGAFSGSFSAPQNSQGFVQQPVGIYGGGGVVLSGGNNARTGKIKNLIIIFAVSVIVVGLVILHAMSFLHREGNNSDDVSIEEFNENFATGKALSCVVSGYYNDPEGLESGELNLIVIQNEGASSLRSSGVYYRGVDYYLFYEDGEYYMWPMNYKDGDRSYNAYSTKLNVAADWAKVVSMIRESFLLPDDYADYVDGLKIRCGEGINIDRVYLPEDIVWSPFEYDENEYMDEDESEEVYEDKFGIE